MLYTTFVLCSVLFFSKHLYFYLKEKDPKWWSINYIYFLQQNPIYIYIFYHEHLLCFVVRFYELKEDYFQQILSNSSSTQLYVVESTVAVKQNGFFFSWLLAVFILLFMSRLFFGTLYCRMKSGCCFLPKWFNFSSNNTKVCLFWAVVEPRQLLEDLY